MNSIKERFLQLIERYPSRIIGLCIGFLVGLLLLTFGFKAILKAILIVGTCTLIGYIIGYIRDKKVYKR